LVSDEEEIEVPGVGGHAPRRCARRVLSDIIEPRVEEIFAVIRKRMEDTGMLEQLSAGAVLTGGAVLLEGMTEFAEEVLGMPVRVGFPSGVKGITQLVQGPQFSTGVGLVKFGAHAIADAHSREPAPPTSQSRMKPEQPEMRRSGFWEWIKQAF
jgi:cell division protein FtsA